MVSHEWIYRHMWKDRDAGGTLSRHLRHRGKKRNSRARGQAGRGCIPGRVDISERPEEEKSRVGDWEGDTIMGARHRGAALSLVDRASRFTFLALLGGSETGERRHLEPEFVHTITTDNGKEFAKAVVRARVVLLRAAVPLLGARPERARFGPPVLPEGDRQLDPAELGRVETLLDNRPRKALDYRTPAEVFDRGLTGAE